MHSEEVEDLHKWLAAVGSDKLHVEQQLLTKAAELEAATKRVCKLQHLADTATASFATAQVSLALTAHKQHTDRMHLDQHDRV